MGWSSSTGVTPGVRLEDLFNNQWRGPLIRKIPTIRAAPSQASSYIGRVSAAAVPVPCLPIAPNGASSYPRQAFQVGSEVSVLSNLHYRSARSALESHSPRISFFVRYIFLCGIGAWSRWGVLLFWLSFAFPPGV